MKKINGIMMQNGIWNEQNLWNNIKKNKQKNYLN